MKQRATRLGWIGGRLIDVGQEFEHDTKINWAVSLEPVEKVEEKPAEKYEEKKDPPDAGKKDHHHK